MTDPDAVASEVDGLEGTEAQKLQRKIAQDGVSHSGESAKSVPMNPAGTSLAPRRTKTQSSSLQLSRGVDAAETRPS